MHLENQRYALSLGMCVGTDPRFPGMPDPACLQRVETRTGWWWHLFYGVGGTL